MFGSRSDWFTLLLLSAVVGQLDCTGFAQLFTFNFQLSAFFTVNDFLHQWTDPHAAVANLGESLIVYVNWKESALLLLVLRRSI